MNAATLLPKLYAAKYYRAAINPAKEFERYCRVSTVEDELTNIINKDVDFTAIPWDSLLHFFYRRK